MFDVPLFVLAHILSVSQLGHPGWTAWALVRGQPSLSKVEVDMKLKWSHALLSRGLGNTIFPGTQKMLTHLPGLTRYFAVV